MSAISPQNALLLERIRARLRAGDAIGQAALACGVGKGVARGLIRRHGLGEAPVVAAPASTGAPRPGGCCWPVSDGRPWVFCDAAHVPGCPYCPPHMARAFIKGGYARTERAFTLARLGGS